eukprot:scaffold114589_cov22-Tisochrysis_lutea.AAC.1
MSSGDAVGVVAQRTVPGSAIGALNASVKSVVIGKKCDDWRHVWYDERGCCESGGSAHGLWQRDGSPQCIHQECNVKDPLLDHEAYLLHPAGIQTRRASMLTPCPYLTLQTDGLRTSYIVPDRGGRTEGRAKEANMPDWKPRSGGGGGGGGGGRGGGGGNRGGGGKGQQNQQGGGKGGGMMRPQSAQQCAPIYPVAGPGVGGQSLAMGYGVPQYQQANNYYAHQQYAAQQQQQQLMAQHAAMAAMGYVPQCQPPCLGMLKKCRASLGRLQMTKRKGGTVLPHSAGGGGRGGGGGRVQGSWQGQGGRGSSNR